MSHLNNNVISNNVLKINVGFLLHQGAGFSRDVELDLPRLQVADDVALAYLRGNLRLTRTARGVLIQGHVLAGYPAECTRCLEAVILQLDLMIEELYVYPATPQAEFVVPEDAVLDLAPLVREEVIVSVPIQALCRPDCQGLDPESGSSMNDVEVTPKPAPIDPRWAVLQQLLGDD